MTLIRVEPADFNNSPPAVNGRSYAVPLAQDFDAGAELVEALTNAGIRFTLVTAPGAADGTVTIQPVPGNRSFVTVAINGARRRLPIGQPITLDAETVALLATAGYRATPNYLSSDTPTPTPTPTPGLARLPLTSRILWAENSFGAQSGNISITYYAWWFAGCRGWPSIGMRQSRAGDPLNELVDRLAPALAVRAGLAFVMSVGNDLSGGDVTNTDAGGAIIEARAATIYDQMKAVGTRVVFQTPPRSQAYLAKPIASDSYRARMLARMAADPDYIRGVLNQADFFDPTVPGASSDETHPDRIPSARALGQGHANAILANFDTAGIFDASPTLPGNVHTWNPATAWTVNTNSSGLSVAQSQSTLRSNPAVACRRFLVTGQATVDPTTSSGTAADVVLTLAIPSLGGVTTLGAGLSAIMMAEITSAADGAPINLATFQLNCGSAQAFTRVKTAGAPGFDFRHVGPIGVFPGLIATQISSTTVYITLRGELAGAMDLDLRISWVNVIPTEAQGYGPKVSAMGSFTTGRPVLYSLPTSSPGAGPLSVGGTLGINNVGLVVGGNLIRSAEAIRGAETVAGAITVARAGVAAAPYTIQAADSAETLRARSKWMAGPDDPFPGSGSVDTAALTVA